MFLLMKQEKNFVWKSWRWCYLNETRNSVFSRGLWCFVRYIQAGGKPKIRQVSWAIWWALTFYDGLTHHWSFGHFHLINIFPQLLRLFRGHSLWKWLKKSHFTTFLKAIWRFFLSFTASIYKWSASVFVSSIKINDFNRILSKYFLGIRHI